MKVSAPVMRLCNSRHPVVLSLSLVLLLLLLPNNIRAQIQIGTIAGTVTDQTGALVRDTEVSLDNPLTGFHNSTTTDEQGAFVFNNVPFGSYNLHVSVKGFQPVAQNINVRSNLPARFDIKLNIIATQASVNVSTNDALVQPDSSSTETTIDESFIRRLPVASRQRELQNVVATTPGWRTENDGLLHVRGVDDGTLYVIDGVPVTDRLDTVSGNSYDMVAVRSLDVITGNIPAEFGGRSGAVVAIQSKSMIGEPLNGSLELGGGSFQAREFSVTVGAGINKRLGFLLTASGNRSERLLDPVDPRNFNNRGGALRFNARTDWHPTTRDILLFTLSANGTDFHITNDLEQERAGQRQRQELRDDSESVRWQRVWSGQTVTDLAYYRQSYESRLTGSAFDTPLFANQNRHDTRQGIIASLTRSFAGQTIKTGFEVESAALDEFFTFAVTDREAAEEREISDAALEFDLAHPFIFRDRKTRGQFSAYAQDTFSPLKHLMINAGVRFDYSDLLVADHQFSPRLGAVYYIAKTKTALRASFNRLYMPPQIENLLLSSSDKARRLSPFATDAGDGSEAVRPEKISAYEVGFAQDFWHLIKLDAAYWSRSFRNFDDPNVFFSTTLIFPNSVAQGTAHGVDVRVDVPDRNGWSGALSYGNARITEIGPINGGLFLTNDFIEIAPGTRFTPDHDERNSASFNVTYRLHRRGVWASLLGRYESGVPLEVDADRLTKLRLMPGADLVNFERGRVRPRSVFDLSTGGELWRVERLIVNAEFEVENLTNRRFVYNFGNPFSGTHFGSAREWSGRIGFIFH